MPVKIPCPQCAAVLKVPEQMLGKTLRCPRCQTSLPTTAPAPTAPAPAPAAPPAPPVVLAPTEGVFKFADEPVSRSAEPLPVAHLPTLSPIAQETLRPRRKKKKGSGRSIVIEGHVIKLAVGIVTALVFAVGGYYLFRWGSKMPPPPDIPESQWQTFAAAGCKVDFPGTPQRQAQSMAGISFVMHMYQADKESVYGIGYTDGQLPESRRSLPTETLLNDSCDGSAANGIQMGGREVRRESIQLGLYPGKQLLIYIPQASGYMISRCYLAGGRLFVAMCGGIGVEDGQKNAKRFFDSFQIVDPGSTSSAPAAPAKPAPGVASSAGPTLQKLGLAMHHYHDKFGHFPPAAITSKDGKPLLSWRVALLPFLGEEKLFGEFKLDEPWDSPDNVKLLPRMPDFLDPEPFTTQPKYSTPLRLLVGKGGLFDGAKGRRIAEIADGSENTILIVEAAEYVAWTEPTELPYDAAKPLPKLGGPSRDSFAACCVSGTVRTIPKTVDETLLRALITRAGGEVVSPP